MLLGKMIFMDLSTLVGLGLVLLLAVGVGWWFSRR
jgi:hypothetical protein